MKSCAFSQSRARMVKSPDPFRTPRSPHSAKCAAKIKLSPFHGLSTGRIPPPLLVKHHRVDRDAWILSYLCDGQQRASRTARKGGRDENEAADLDAAGRRFGFCCHACFDRNWDWRSGLLWRLLLSGASCGRCPSSLSWPGLRLGRRLLGSQPRLDQRVLGRPLRGIVLGPQRSRLGS